ncbi:MAG: glycosyltransferase [Saprospiraceae bacterium]
MGSIGVVALCVLSLLYALLLWRIRRTWLTHPTPPDAAHNIAALPYISVIVPARNEAAHIRSCCEALLQQDYPAHLFDVWVIDDHSTDGTAREAAQCQHPNLHIRSLSEAPHAGQGKKAALAWGIAHSTGAFILTTDADCLPSSNWLRSFGKAMQRGGDMWLAPVSIAYRPGLLYAFQALDVAGTMLLTGATALWGQPILANGANMAFRRSLFHRLGGYAGNAHRASGDDIFLLQKAVAAHASVRYITHKEALIDTHPEHTWRALWQQRLRWASKTNDYTTWHLPLLSAGVFALSLLLLLSTWCYWVSTWHGGWIVAAWLLKMGADFFYLRTACRLVADARWMLWFLPAQLLHVVYIVFLGMAALIPTKVVWKQRTVR